MSLYVPSPSELKSKMLTEGSFIINRLEPFEVTLCENERNVCNGEDDNDNNDMLIGSNNL